MARRIRFVFMGSADFGLPALRRLLDLGHMCAGVVSTPPRPRGRGLQVRESVVSEFARQHNLGPLLCPVVLNDPEFIAQLQTLQADIFIVVAFRILPPSVFLLPPLGTVNIHASLLPRYRGPAPIQRAIQAGEQETGVTVFQIDTGIDTGQILARSSTGIGPDETTPQLYERLSALGAEVLVDALDDLLAGKAVPVAQNTALACPAPKLKKEEARLDWQRHARDLNNQIRAFKPFPGTWAPLHGRRLGIERAEVVTVPATAGPVGSVVTVGAEWFDVVCGEQGLRIYECKPEGKNVMSVKAFLCGTRLGPGDSLL